MLKVVAVRRGGDNYREVSKLKLSDGRVVTRDEACNLVDSGDLPGYLTATSSTGERFLRGENNDDPSDNLQNMPEF